MVRKVHKGVCVGGNRANAVDFGKRATAQRVTSIGEGDQDYVVHDVGVGLPAANVGTYRCQNADVEVEQNHWRWSKES